MRFEVSTIKVKYKPSMHITVVSRRTVKLVFIYVYCIMSRFDAKEVLERLRGKRVIFVGDSVNRNQWVSMVCMLQKVIPPELKEMRKIRHVSLRTFKAIVSISILSCYWWIG